MAKEKDDVTPEVTNQQAAGTHRPGFSTQVTDAPDYNQNNPNAATPSSGCRRSRLPVAKQCEV